MLISRFIKQVLISIVVSIFVYASAIILLSFSFPMQDPMDTTIDTTLTLTSTIFHNHADHIVLGRKPYKKDKRRMIFIGPSNVMMAFKPMEMQKYVHDYEVGSAVAYTSNISTNNTIVDLIYEAIPETSYQDTTFVLGLSFLLFVDNKSLSSSPMKTPIEKEMTKYGLYRLENGKIIKNRPDWVIDNFYYFLLPSMYIDKTISSITKSLQPDHLRAYKKHLSKKIVSGNRSPGALVSALLKPSTYKTIFSFSTFDDKKPNPREKALMLHHEFVGTEDNTINYEQFHELELLVEKITSHGGTIILVQMPHPAWFKERSPHYQNYQGIIEDTTMLAKKYDDVFYIDLTDMDNEDDFYDTSHPKPEATDSWCRRLASEISQLSGSRK